MKQYDRDSIALRVINRIRREDPWVEISDDATELILINNLCDPIAEINRYNEYLSGELFWGKARNLSSLINLSSIVGYTPKRRRSSLGEVVFSLDPTLLLVGTLKDNINADLYELEDVKTPSSVTTSVTLPRGTNVSSTTGTNYLTTRQVILAPDLDYVKIPVIQGLLQSYVVNNASGTDFEEIVINSAFVEEGESETSNQFFTVKITYGSTVEIWEYIDDIRLANVHERKYEVRNNRNLDKVTIKFGNGILGRRLPYGAKVEVNFLNTLGEEGNTTNRRKITKLKTIVKDSLGIEKEVFCTNLSPITGGTNVETIDEIKANAPRDYLTQKSIVTIEQYIATLEKMTNIYKATVYGGVGVDNQGREKDIIFFSSITDKGEASDPSIEEQVIETIGKRNSPTDTLEYKAPNFIQLVFNTDAKTMDYDIPTDLIQSAIKETIKSEYKALSMDFGDSLEHSVYTTKIQAVDNVNNHKTYIEAMLDVENTDITDVSGIKFFQFEFPKQFGRFKNFDEGVNHTLRVEFTDLKSPLYNRTFLITADGLKAFPTIADITTPDLVTTKLQAYDPNSDVGLDSEYFTLSNYEPALGSGTLHFGTFLSGKLSNSRDYSKDHYSYQIRIFSEPVDPNIHALYNTDFFKLNEDLIKVQVKYQYGS